MTAMTLGSAGQQQARCEYRSGGRRTAADSDRGPLLIVSGEKDNTVPRAISHAAFTRQQNNPGVTEFSEIADRGHSLTIDHGRSEVAQTALSFIKPFA
jgi:non-heme chloroperoxidase